MGSWGYLLVTVGFIPTASSGSHPAKQKLIELNAGFGQNMLVLVSQCFYAEMGGRGVFG